MSTRNQAQASQGENNDIITPLDLLRYRQLLFGTPPATQAWSGETANHPQP